MNKNNKFNAKETKDACVKWIHDFFEKNGPDCNAVIGLSGGKDSTIVAALCAEALGKDRVLGVMIPNQPDDDTSFAEEIAKYIGIKYVIVPIEPSYNAIIQSMESANMNPSQQSIINLPSRLRMAVLYAVSQSANGRVSNNCNLSENWIGYCTRYGDSAGDFAPLANLTVSEVKAIGYELGLKPEYIEKIPSDGLCGKTDEDNFGFTYNTLDNYIRYNIEPDPDIKTKIDSMHEKNTFKFNSMPSFE